jgi:hypothetical protein
MAQYLCFGRHSVRIWIFRCSLVELLSYDFAEATGAVCLVLQESLVKVFLDVLCLEVEDRQQDARSL